MRRIHALALLVLLPALLLFVPLLFSADPPPKPDDPAPVKGRLPLHWKKLGLSDDQVKQVYAVEEKHKEKIAALEQQLADEKAALRMEEDAILTDAQKAALRGILDKGLSDPAAVGPPKDK